MSVTQEFQQNIMNWIKNDNQIKEKNKEIREMREKQTLLEDNITTFAVSNNMEKHQIVVSSLKCSVKCAESEKYDNLSFRLLKDSLDDYFNEKNINLDVEDIIKFIKKRRLKKTKIYLKRQELSDEDE
tara:strand:+ start:537 stop:920 length:384 start_codon:yes stop_codon:yes gene_type:complete